MFENPGKTLKTLGKIAFLIGWIACLAEGWYLSAGEKGEFKIWLFLAFLIGGFIVAYLSSIGIVAFGELVENSQTIKEELQKMTVEKKQANDNLPTERILPLSQRTPASSGTSKVLPTQNNQQPPTGITVKKATSGTWRCDSCGLLNDMSVEVCQCGTKKPWYFG